MILEYPFKCDFLENTEVELVQTFFPINITLKSKNHSRKSKETRSLKLSQ